MLAVLNAILYVVVQGCKWRDIPADLTAWSTAYTYFRRWRDDGTWWLIHDRLRSWFRVSQGLYPSPSEVIIDSQRVATATMVREAAGFDGAKWTKGRKHHAAVDTLGLLLCVLVTAANVPEWEGARQLLKKVQQIGAAVSRLYLIWADGGYSGAPFLR